MATNIDSPKAETGSLDLIIPDDIQVPKAADVAEKVKAGYEDIYKKLEAERADVPNTVETKADREKIKSLAYKISQTKVALKKRTIGMIEDHKSIVKAVTSERTAMESKMDAWRDEVRAPLTEWEEADKARVQKVEDAFNFIHGIKSNPHDGVDYADMTSDQISALSEKIKSTMPADVELFDELAEKYDGLAAQTILDLNERADRLKDQEAERAELEKMRAEKAAREEADRIAAEEKAEADRIAALKAEQAKRDAEAEARAKAAAAEELEREKQRADEAEERRKQIEASRIAYEAEEKKRRDEADAREAAERERFAAEAEKKRLADIEAERMASEARARQAVEDERERAAEVERQRVIAEEKRLADEKHVDAINTAIKQALSLTTPGATMFDIDSIVSAIAAGKIPHVKITY